MFGLKESESIVNRGDRIDIGIPMNVNTNPVLQNSRVAKNFNLKKNTDHLKKRAFTFDSSILASDRWEDDVRTS